MIQDYVAFTLKQPLRVWKGGPAKSEDEDCWAPHPSGKTRAPATVNRYLPLLRAAFRRAYLTRDKLTRQRAIEEIPVIAELPEMKRKARPVPDVVLVDMMAILPTHVVEALKVTLFFGFRRNEVFSLTIGQVDFNAGGIALKRRTSRTIPTHFFPAAAMQYSSSRIW